MTPWYTIVRRLVFIGPLYVLLCFAWLLLACGWGLGDAQRFWEDVT